MNFMNFIIIHWARPVSVLLIQMLMNMGFVVTDCVTVSVCMLVRVCEHVKSTCMSMHACVSMTVNECITCHRVFK